MAESVVKGYFPSQVVPDAEKLSAEYGLQVGRPLSTSGLMDLRLIKDTISTKLSFIN